MTTDFGVDQESAAAPLGQPQVQVLSREAGSALDALVAERVMGFRVCDFLTRAPADRPCNLFDTEHFHPNGEHVRYSTELAASWMVVTKVIADAEASADQQGIEVLVAWSPSARRWRVQFHDLAAKMRFSCERAESVPLAICRAALVAVGAA